MDKPRIILLVEDDRKDVELILASFRESKLTNHIVVTRDGAAALDYLYQEGEFSGREGGDPILILLDLKMPKVSGIEVIRRLKTDPVKRLIPIVVLTSSREQTDLAQCYELGVNSYVVKPVKFTDFSRAVEHLRVFWTLVNEPPPVLPTEVSNGAHTHTPS